MLRYLLLRAGTALIVVAGVASLVFFLIHLIPGDPVDVMLGESAAASDRAQLRRALNLDLPVLQQWLNYLHGLVRLDWGYSLFNRQAVTSQLAAHALPTLQLTVAALALAIAIGVPLGVVAAVRRATVWDRLATGFSLLGISIPNFWLGPLLVLLFSILLGWLPVSGRGEPGSWVLPALTLGSGMAAVLARMVRSSLLDVLHEDFMRTARAKGLAGRQVILRHGLPNAMLPVLTLVGLQLGALLGGAVVTETLFNWPGIGLLTIESIQRRDYPLVQGCVLLISVSYVIVNLLTDLAYSWIDPRIKLEGTA
jgi:peptide/nickel transport system permease protein